jgi:hypothetical protein
MPAATNKRIFYAIEQVGIKADGGSYNWGDADVVYGAQSVGITTNYNLVQAFELGQLAIYENIEEIPDVEVTLSKLLDGSPLMFHLSTQDASSPTLAGRSTAKCMFAMGIFPDTNESATGNPPSLVACSGMFVGSAGYNFPLDDNFTEDVTLVGNHKIWLNQPGYGDTLATLPDPNFPGATRFANNNDTPPGTGGVNRRQDMQFEFVTGSGLDVNGMVADPDATILPPEVFGISNSGTNEKSNGIDFDAHLSNITVSVDFGREAINELGRKGPYHRFVTFPVEVSTEIEITATSGDVVSATEEGIYTTGAGQCDDLGNLKDRTIRISTCEGTRIYLGTKNKLASVNYTGGEAGGGNVSVSYSYTTFNDFTVLHPEDVNSSGATWWTERGSYLVDL